MKTMQNKLQQDVMDELQWDPSVDSSRIGISVDNGVVVLSGNVRSLAERLSAENAAKRVRGVLSVANELHVDLPGASLRDDAALAKAARDALRWNVLVPDESLQVTVSKGWITLEGEVPYGYQSRTAVSVVEQLTGVVGVTNRIVIKPSASPLDVQRKLTSALHRHVQLEAQNIETEVTGGKVVLRGKVGSWAERSLVEDAAWSAPGVREVDNRLEVRT
jgi:osmotically-inducible protein OsmY